MMENGNLNIPELVERILTQKLDYYAPQTDPPLVSIISSFYNSHLYFDETYHSIFNQTMQNFEWIIVDDCSTNKESINFFNNLESRSEKIKTFRHEENKGPSAGRNTAIAQARGKYLFFIDCDDLIDPTYLEKCVLFLELYPEYSFVNSYCIGFNEQEYWWNRGFESQSEFIHENLITIMLMYKKADFDALGGFDEDLRCFEDWDRWLKALVNDQKGWTIPEYLHCYRRSDAGLLESSQKEEFQQKRTIQQIQNRYLKLFNEKPKYWQHPFDQSSNYDVFNFRQILNLNNQYCNERLRNKRILFLYPHLEVGGADRYNLDLLGILKERGYQLTIATTLRAKNAWHKHFYKITPDIFHLSNYADETKWLAIVKNLIESRQIDVVFISNSYFAYYLLPHLRSLYQNVAFIDNVHIYDPGWRFDGYPRLSRQFNEFFDAQIVTSKHLADYNVELEPSSKDKFSVCTTNINPQLWNYDEIQRKDVREKHNIGEEDVLIIFPARLESQKRPDFFVRIIKKLIENGLSVKAIILGEGSLFTQVNNLINELEIAEYFIIMPPINPDLMSQYYSAADILLLPTNYEGISLSLFEAMAMNLSIVASDVGGQRELIIDGTGYLITKGIGDSSEIDAYYEILLPLIKDQKLRKKIGKSARKRIIEFFSLQAMGNRIEEILSKAINNRKENTKNLTTQLIAEELLTNALEVSRMERELYYLHTNLQHLQSQSLQKSEYFQLRDERDLLLHQKQNMEASKFWKLRQRWFKFKYKMGLSKFES